MLKISTKKTGKASTKTTGAETFRRYDILKKGWVSCNQHGYHEGRPVFTTKLARVLRTLTLEEAAQKFSVSRNVALELKKQADAAYLPLFDARGRYRNKQPSGCEDAMLEMSAVQWRELNLPPDALQRLLELRKKKGLD